jgi:membrane complex biogenesis BtpA family protein
VTATPPLIQRLFGTSKPLIGMLHAKAFPGRPGYDRAGGLDAIVDGLQYDLTILQEVGVDGLLFCNEMDLPYQLSIDHEVTAGMAAAIGRLHHQITLPFGVDLAWDAHASIAVAAASGACFVRQVFTGVFDTDMGLMNPSFGDLAAYRRTIGAEDIALISNVTPEFGGSVSGRSINDRVRGAVFLGIDGVIVSGLHTGLPTDLDHVREAKEAAGDCPVLISSGVTLDTLEASLDVADGVIVGTSMKVDGSISKPLDRERVKRMVDRLHAWRGRVEA